MARVVPFTKNREVVYDLLTRAKRFHCPVSSTWELEVEALEQARRKTLVNDRPVGITACLIKATGLVLERYPKFNQHLFHGLFRKYLVEFDTIRCNLILMRRGANRERLLFPLIVEDANSRSIEEIQGIIDHNRTAPLEELPQVQSLQKIKRMPRLLLSWFSYRVRSDHRFYEKYFGTYGVSSLATRAARSARGAHGVANTGAAFFLGPVQKRPVVKGDAVVAREVLPLLLVVDHFVLDGLDVVDGVAYLRRLLAEPERLGLKGEAGA